MERPDDKPKNLKMRQTLANFTMTVSFIEMVRTAFESFVLSKTSAEWPKKSSNLACGKYKNRGLGALYSETCVKHTSATFHYNVCSKMMACTWNMLHATCYKWMPSYNEPIHL